MKNFVKIKGVADGAWHLVDVEHITHAITIPCERNSTIYLMDGTKLHSSWTVLEIAEAIQEMQHSKFRQRLTEDKGHHAFKAEDAAQDLEKPELDEELFAKELETFTMFSKSGMILRDLDLGQTTPERFSAWLLSIFLKEVKTKEPIIAKEDWRHELREDIRLGRYVNAVIGERFMELMRYDGSKMKITVDFHNISEKPNNPEI